MKMFITLALALSPSLAAASPAPSAQLFDALDNKLVPSTRVEDSVFYYKNSELTCEANDEETPCLATNDHWNSICFKGDIEAVCSEFSKLFGKSSEQLISNGAEENVELTSCSSKTGITILSYDLMSFHGGPNVTVKDKMIPMCPIFF